MTNRLKQVISSFHTDVKELEYTLSVFDEQVDPHRPPEGHDDQWVIKCKSVYTITIHKNKYVHGQYQQKQTQPLL
jgi:hypothetical protein